MKFATSIKFCGLRDLAIIWSVRTLKVPVDYVLQMSRNEIGLTDCSQVVFQDALIAAPDFLRTYLALSTTLFPVASFAFPTDDGLQYRKGKFAARLRALMIRAGIEKLTSDPTEISPQDFTKLIQLEFDFRRPDYQQALAVTLSSHLGLRPNESAKLLTTDINFENRIIK